jgi:2-dehydro-3-deoxygalactonokinase
MFGGDFIGIDWGTTNRRVYLIEEDRVSRTERDDHGAARVAHDGFAEEAANIRARFGDLPILMAGMVGSTVGWREAPYVACPAGLADLAGHLLQIDARTAIVPGLSLLDGGRADVMRGEEVQFLGAVEAGLVPPDCLLVQPGTHSKWARIADGRIADFTTAMTGELFALLKTHSLLSAQLQAEVVAGPAFDAGVADGARRDLAASMFGVRAAKLLGQRADDDAASFASGILIGAEVSARLAEDTETVHILADPVLGGLYARAIAQLGGSAVVVDSDTAFAAGLIALGSMS